MAFTITSAHASGRWDYKVNASDTPEIVDITATTAEVDILQNEIRLPENTAGMVAFWPDGSPDFIVMTPTKISHYSFDGTKYAENTILDITPEATPKAIAAPKPFPEIKLAAGAEIMHYSFTGSGYARNTPLEKSDMDKAFTLSANKVGEFASLVDMEVQRYNFDGTFMVRNTTFEPTEPLDCPIDAKLFSDGSDLVVLEKDKLRVFRWGVNGTPQPTVTVASGITAPKCISTAKKDIALVDGNTVIHYSYNGSEWSYNEALSVASELDNARAVALRHESFDRIIIDGNKVKYYRWDGTNLVYDMSMSVDVPGLETVTYRPYATIQSLAFNPDNTAAKKVRVMAYHNLPDNTAVTWSVTSNGVNWVTRWRVRNQEGITVCEVNDGGVWTVIGDASQATPDADNLELWADTIPPGISVKWKAELLTTNVIVTPKIKPEIPGGIAVSWQAGTPPDKPVIDPIGSACFTTSTPTITWRYTDPDGDPQYAYRFLVRRQSDDAVVYDSGKVIDGLARHTIVSSNSPDVPSALWSSGVYQFKAQVMVWDDFNMNSPWSDPVDFCIVAFERPRIAEIVSAPDGQVKPDPVDLSTHIVITPKMTIEQLPKVKAGSRVKLLIDNIGPINNFSILKFPYLARESTVKMPVVNTYPTGTSINRWEIDFWTDANLEICPTGTVVKMQMTGDAGDAGATMFNAPPYAAGVVETQGSIYEDWLVVLQGRDN